MPLALIAAGANLGNRQRQLDEAVAELRRAANSRVLAVSRWHETAPLGGPAGQPAFLNGALLLETSLDPHALLQLLHRLESAAGRRRDEPWGARTLDLDLLLYGDLQMESPQLTLPHPRLAWRPFVLDPANEIAPDLVHPGIGWSIHQLWEHWRQATNYIAVTGPPRAGKQRLIDDVVRSSGFAVHAIAETEPARSELACEAASLPWRREIEFVNQRKRLLDRTRWNHQVEAVLSDFWFGQSLAYASLILAADQYQAFVEIWQQSQATVMPPKLLVWLDDHQRTALPDATSARLGDALASTIGRVMAGPMVRFDASQPDLARRELLAVLESMHAACLTR